GRGPTHSAIVTFERGLTHDSNFEAWVNALVAPLPGNSYPTAKRNFVVETMNEAAMVAQTYKLHQCWASAYQALPDLDANANAVAISLLKFECGSISH